MFQTAASFVQLRNAVTSVLYNDNHTGLDINTPLFKQLRHSIVLVLYNFFDSVNFFFDNNGVGESRPRRVQGPGVPEENKDEDMFVDVQEQTAAAAEKPPSVAVVLQPACLPSPKQQTGPKTAANNKFVSANKRGASSAQGFRRSCMSLRARAQDYRIEFISDPLTRCSKGDRRYIT
jgi:hypothetical protein